MERRGEWVWRQRSVLKIYSGLYCVRHNRETRVLSSSPSLSGSVSVFLDSEAGALSFYDVHSDGRLLHLHTFTSSSFSEPLFPGFALWEPGSSVSVVDLRRAPPAPPTCEEEEPQPGASNETEEAEFTPEVTRDSAHLSYRFRCPSSGTFRCSSTGLVFVVTEEAELHYRIVQWDEALLMSSGKAPAGPLYHIECPERAVCELHLPHCEPESVELSQSQLSVAHISDSGLSLIQPERITESHVVISVSGLSLFGLVWQWLSGQRPVSGQVLLFCTPGETSRRLKKLLIHVHLLPSNIPMKEVQSRQERVTQHLDAISKCELVKGRRYSVVCPSAELVQPNRSLFEIYDDPNYHPSFELWLPPESSTVPMTLREYGSLEGDEVWSCQLILTGAAEGDQTSRAEEPLTDSEHPGHRAQPIQQQRSAAPQMRREQWNTEEPSTSSHRDDVTLLIDVRPDFVDNVSDPILDQLLDQLLKKRVLTSEEMDTAKQKPRADKARAVVDAAIRKGRKASSVLIQEYCELDPWSDLCETLRPSL